MTELKTFSVMFGVMLTAVLWDETVILGCHSKDGLVEEGHQ